MLDVSTYIHTHIYAYTHICMYSYMYVYVCMYVHAHIHKNIPTYLHTHIYIHNTYIIHTHIHTHIHTYIHTFTHTHTHTHTHKRQSGQRSRCNNQVAGWTVRVRKPKRSRIFFLASSRLVLGPTHPPPQWVKCILFFRGISGRGVKLNIHLHTVKSLRMTETIPLLSYTYSWH